ncbi:MAG: hypothetical protein WAU78_07070, partial [Roseiarcus sp.]
APSSRRLYCALHKRVSPRWLRLSACVGRIGPVENLSPFADVSGAVDPLTPPKGGPAAMDDEAACGEGIA